MEKGILLVDDDNEFRFILSYILEKKGYRVYEASNGINGLRIFEKMSTSIDLVITDFDMPFLNGADMLKEILTISPYIPNFIVSGQKDFDFKYNGMNKDRTNFVEKPIQPFQFEKLIEESLSENQVGLLNQIQ